MRSIGVLLVATLALLPRGVFAEPAQEPIRMTTSLTRAVCGEGESVTMEVALHNGGSEKRMIGYGAFAESSLAIKRRYNRAMLTVCR
jgi:hypothetical protein